VPDIAAPRGDVANLVEELKPARIGGAQVRCAPEPACAQRGRVPHDPGDEVVGGLLKGRPVAPRFVP